VGIVERGEGFIWIGGEEEADLEGVVRVVSIVERERGAESEVRDPSARES